MQQEISRAEIINILQLTPRRVDMLAKQEQWLFRKIYKSGANKKFFFIHSLPEPLKIKIYQSIAKAEKLKYASKAKQKQDIIILNEKKRIYAAQEAKLHAKLSLLKRYTNYLEASAWGKKTQAREDFNAAYNNSKLSLHQDIYNIIGYAHWKTIEGWKVKLKQSGDISCLADDRGYIKRGQTKLAKNMQNEIKAAFYMPNASARSDAEIIRIAKASARAKKIQANYSESTLRRYITDFKQYHADQYIGWREGTKGLKDKCLPYLNGDYSKLQVGDEIVGDGHILNFTIQNPYCNNQPKRMMLVLFTDKKSDYPLGWDITPTEDAAAISVALRRSILTLGKLPRSVRIDNGRAFKANNFIAKFQKAGYEGLYQRLGIETTIAIAYNARSKPIERYFRDMSAIEALSPSFVGTSVANKPPQCSRGEKRFLAIYNRITNGYIPTLEQAHLVLSIYFDEHARRKQGKSSKRAGLSPHEIFQAGKGEGFTTQEIKSLQILMKKQTLRTIRNATIQIENRRYYNEALYGKTMKVIIRYDSLETNSIYVFDAKTDNYICEAQQLQDVHTVAKLGTDKDRAELNKQMAEQVRLEKQTYSTIKEKTEKIYIQETRAKIENHGFKVEAEAEAKKPQKKILYLENNETKLTAEQKQAIEAEAETIQAADMLTESLYGLSDMDKYEKLLQAFRTNANANLSEDQTAFMRYYENTTEYLINRPDWEQKDINFTLLQAAK